MSTVIRTELSKKNKYYIPKERYLELRHFVNQFHSWHKELNSINMIANKHERIGKNDTLDTSAIERLAIKSYELSSKMAKVYTAIKLAFDFSETAKHYHNGFLSMDIIDTDGIEPFTTTVINGLSYDNSEMVYWMSRTRYYELYRKFFYELDKIRD